MNATRPLIHVRIAAGRLRDRPTLAEILRRDVAGQCMDWPGSPYDVAVTPWDAEDGFEVQVQPVEDVESLSALQGGRMEAAMRYAEDQVSQIVDAALYSPVVAALVRQ